MQKMIVIDPLNKENGHLFFNASILSSIDHDQPTIFIGEVANLQKILKLNPNLKNKSIRSGSFVIRIIKSMTALVGKTALRFNKVVFLCLDNTMVPASLILLYPLLFQNKFFIILHNNFGTLSANRYKRALHKLMMRIYNMETIVLTKEMKKQYQKLFPGLRCTFIPHPNYTTLIDYTPSDKLPVTIKTHIILLGRQAKLMTDKLLSINLKKFENLLFTIVIKDAHLYSKSGLPNLSFINKRLTYDEYYSILTQADFALFAQDENVLNRASGILIDCISLDCPVIAPSGGHFDEFKKFEIGYFYDNYDDLEEIFAKINLKNPKRNYFGDNFKKAVEYTNLHNWKIESI